MDSEKADWSARPGRSPAQSASVTLGDGRKVEALATNVSPEGCQLLADAHWSVGETLVLTLADRGSIRAQVRWTAGDRAGIKFLSEGSAEQRRA